MPTAKVDTAAAGDTTIIAAVTGGKIRLLGFVIVAAGAVTATWKLGATAVSGPMTLATGIPLSVTFGDEGIALGAISEALVLTLGGAVQVSGHVCYQVHGPAS